MLELRGSFMVSIYQIWKISLNKLTNKDKFKINPTGKIG
jgi:hypothetical protein